MCGRLGAAGIDLHLTLQQTEHLRAVLVRALEEQL